MQLRNGKPRAGILILMEAALGFSRDSAPTKCTCAWRQVSGYLLYLAVRLSICPSVHPSVLLPTHLQELAHGTVGVAGWRPREEFESKGCPLEKSPRPGSSLIFSPGLRLVEWGPPTRWRVICFTQSPPTEVLTLPEK